MNYSRRRVVFLSGNYYEQIVGGAEYQSYLLAEEALRLGYDVHYIFISNGKPFNKSLEINLHMIPKKNLRRKLGQGNFLYFCPINNLLRKIQPDLIYQRVGSALTGIAARYARQHTIRMIWHISHDKEVISRKGNGIRGKLTDVFDRLFLNHGIRNADVVIGQTHDQNAMLKKHFGRECDAIIPNGHPCPKDPVKKPENVYVLWVANMKPWKQPEIFLELAKSIGNMTNMSFLMIGRLSSPRRHKRLLAEIDKIPNLEYLGEIPNDEVNKRLSEAHILVNTSRYEGFSNTFIQAWMRRVPVVSLNVDPDGILVRKGIGFRSKTFEQLVCDVTLLLENKPLREEMGARARRYAMDNHAAKKMVEEVIGFFE